MATGQERATNEPDPGLPPQCVQGVCNGTGWRLQHVQPSAGSTVRWQHSAAHTHQRARQPQHSAALHALRPLWRGHGGGDGGLGAGGGLELCAQGQEEHCAGRDRREGRSAVVGCKCCSTAQGQAV